MNRDVEKFSDQRVRQAVAMCVDRQALVDAFYPPASLAADQFIPPGLLGHTEGFTWYPRDVEAARALLAEAGYADGLDATLSLREVARGYMPEPSKVAEAIQAQLAECGVNVTIDVIESGAFLDAAAAGDLEMGLLGWLADYPDATNWFDFRFMGTGAGDQLTSRSPTSSSCSLRPLRSWIRLSARPSRSGQRPLRVCHHGHFITAARPWRPLLTLRGSWPAR